MAGALERLRMLVDAARAIREGGEVVLRRAPEGRPGPPGPRGEDGLQTVLVQNYSIGRGPPCPWMVRALCLASFSDGPTPFLYVRSWLTGDRRYLAKLPHEEWTSRVTVRVDSREEAVERAHEYWERLFMKFYQVAEPLGFFDEGGPDARSARLAAEAEAKAKAPVEALREMLDEVPHDPKPPRKRAFDSFKHEPEPKK